MSGFGGWYSERHRRLWEQVAPRMPHDDLAHDAEHVRRVYRWCLALAPEAAADPELAGAAGLVHDLVAIPKDHPDRPLGGERSAAAAGGLLGGVGYEATAVQAVVEAVRTCSWSRGLAPTGPLGRVLQDADRLDALGVLGLARMFATAQRMGGGRLYHPGDPAGTARALDDRHYALDHVARKLRHLVAGLHTSSARAEGARREAAMETAVAELRREIAAPL